MISYFVVGALILSTLIFPIVLKRLDDVKDNEGECISKSNQDLERKENETDEKLSKTRDCQESGLSTVEIVKSNESEVNN